MAEKYVPRMRTRYDETIVKAMIVLGHQKTGHPVLYTVWNPTVARADRYGPGGRRFLHHDQP